MAVATMVLIFTVGFSNFRDFQQRQNLQSSTREFRADLRFTQSQALAGVRPAGCVVLDFYRISYVSATQYDISAYCDAGATPAVPIKTVDLAPGMHFLNAFNIDFKVLGRGTNLTGSLVITLEDSSTPANQIQVTVTPGGEIS